MTRHSKNCTASSVYSYHEKKKDSSVSGFGSLKLRYGKDAIKDFDCCNLSLHPCREPVITKEGYLFDKESIYEYIVSKKNENKRKMKKFDKQCQAEQNEINEIGEAEHRSMVEKFLKTEGAVSSASQAAPQTGPSTSSSQVKTESVVSNMYGSLAKKLPSFWVPSLTPENKVNKLNKPDMNVYCPVSGKILKIKDLIPVKFTLINTDDTFSTLAGKQERYKCPVTGDVLRNNVPVAVLKSTGDVVTMECIKLIQKDMIHPLTSQKITDEDIIELQRGGTGFAQANEKLVGAMPRPCLQV